MQKEVVTPAQIVQRERLLGAIWSAFWYNYAAKVIKIA